MFPPADHVLLSDLETASSALPGESLMRGGLVQSQRLPWAAELRADVMSLSDPGLLSVVLLHADQHASLSFATPEYELGVSRLKQRSSWRSVAHVAA